MTFYSSSVPDSSFDSLSFIVLCGEDDFKKPFLQHTESWSILTFLWYGRYERISLLVLARKSFIKFKFLKSGCVGWYNMFTKMCEEAFVKGILIRASSLRRRIGCLLNSY